MKLSFDNQVNSSAIILTTLIGSVGVVLYILYQTRKQQSRNEDRTIQVVQRPIEEVRDLVPERDDLLLQFANHPDYFSEIQNFHFQGRFSLNTRNELGHSLVMVCAALNLIEPMQWLSGPGNERETIDWTAQTLKKCETAIWLAARCGHLEILEMILKADQAKTSLELRNESGATPLLAAIMSRSFECVQTLLDHGADPNTSKLDKMTALMVAVTMGRLDIVQLLLETGKVQIDVQDRFGMSALIHAAYRGQRDIAELLLQNGADINIVDHDKMSCLHHACKEAPKPSWPCPLDTVDHLATLQLLLQRGADVNALDAGGATALHVVACRVAVGSTDIARVLLENGGDLTIETLSGWTALHNASDHHLGNGQVRDLFIEWASTHLLSDFLSRFDPQKPREFKPKLRNEPKRAPIQMDEVLNHLVSGIFKNVVVLSGAGMSVSAGIPAFRTAGGLYDQTSAFNNEDEALRPSNLFRPETFETNPELFYSFIRRVFLHKEATVSHRFIGELYQRGVLRRWYTQNIDGLEHQVGIPKDKIVESHGTLLLGRCQYCNITSFSNKNDHLQAVYLKALLETDEVPLCPYCQSCLRPAVTFFGEPMNERFVQLRPNDMQSCDLLIVIGTSLTVYPFAALVSDVGLTVPRILINCDAVGPWSATVVSSRDVFLQGFCDEVISDRLIPKLSISSSSSS